MFVLLTGSSLPTNLPTLHPAAKDLWSKVFTQGHVVGPHSTGTPFAEIQLAVEREMVAALKRQPKGSFQGMWIIHTPLIATPLVTQGQLNAQLVAKEIMADNDKTRLNTALERAQVLREYLALGGVVVVAYQQDKRVGVKGRTQEQISVFEALKIQYPQNLIEFPIISERLSGGEYPQNRIGATYIMPLDGDIVEMTNLGVQIQNPSQQATWGVWLQHRQHPHAQVTERMRSVFHFLQQAGLVEVLENHAKFQGIASEKMITLIECYLSSKE